MAKPKERTEQPTRVSQLWPKLLAPDQVEAEQLLVDQPGYKLLQAEWADQLADLSYRLEHSAKTMEEVNFLRGQLAAIRTNIGFEEDLAEWKNNSS